MQEPQMKKIKHIRIQCRASQLNKHKELFRYERYGCRIVDYPRCFFLPGLQFPELRLYFVSRYFQSSSVKPVINLSSKTALFKLKLIPTMKLINVTPKGIVSLQKFFKGLSQWFPLLLVPVAIAGIVLFLLRLYFELMVKVVTYFIVVEGIQQVTKQAAQAPARNVRPAIRLAIG
jgi:hypothetical protein